ncbi:FAD binding domain-containing protein [Apiospora rasikravindrae]|uniref:FAD binding domain-containing protein n=1 Tax=Apiospora rasikravindrae TaxID=990691 RepID=A0ABR1SCG3_9PEZI
MNANVSKVLSLGDRARQHEKLEQSLRCMSYGASYGASQSPQHHCPVRLAASASTTNTFDTVSDTTSIQVSKRFSIDYANALQPSYILFSKSPNECQALVSILCGNIETFAVKPDGQNPN